MYVDYHRAAPLYALGDRARRTRQRAQRARERARRSSAVRKRVARGVGIPNFVSSPARHFSTRQATFVRARVFFLLDHT